MRRLGILWVVLLTIGMLVVGMAGGATPHARAQDDACYRPPATPMPGQTEQSSPPVAFTGDANAYTFTVGKAGDSFTVAATGDGQATSISITAGTLPAGVTCAAPAWEGILTLSGTPDRGTGGTYHLTFTAYNQLGASDTRSFTLTVDEAPAITSANTAAFMAGTASTFTVKAKGYPTPSISETGTLPSGVTFRNNGDGTATLSGAPGGGTGATFQVTFTAANGVAPDATQSFTLTVTATTQAPAITSANTAAFAAGKAGTFTVTTTGSPTPKITITAGSLPSGVTFRNNGDGTATLSGAPGGGTGATFQVTFTAANGVAPDATQSFTLTVTATTQAPAITSANTAAFAAGKAGTFTVTTTGSPTPKITITAGSLPSGVTFRNNGDGTATLSGAPGGGTGATFQVSFTAANGVAPDATQSFTLTVTATTQAPAITSANTAAFAAGKAGTFTVTTTGSPTPKITITAGSLPSGVTFRNNGDGTATLSGAPGGGTGATFQVSFTAANGVAPDATQSFFLTTVPPTSPSSSPAAPWWLAALTAIGGLIAVTAGAVILRRVRRRRANLRKRIRAVPHPEAGTVNLDRSEPALAHTVRLEPHADRGALYLEDEP